LVAVVLDTLAKRSSYALPPEVLNEDGSGSNFGLGVRGGSWPESGKTGFLPTDGRARVKAPSFKEIGRYEMARET